MNPRLCIAALAFGLVSLSCGISNAETTQVPSDTPAVTASPTPEVTNIPAPIASPTLIPTKNQSPPTSIPTISLDGLTGEWNAIFAVLKDKDKQEVTVGMHDETLLHLGIDYPIFTFSGDLPWVDVSGTISSTGFFTAAGSGAVAGFDDIWVILTGTLTSTIDGIYTVGTAGGLPGGSPIVYQVTASRRITQEMDLPASSQDFEAVVGFAEQFNQAMAARDQEFLLHRLHPAVYDIYGEERCREYLAGVIDQTFSIDVLEVFGPAGWEWQLDGQVTVLNEVFTIQAARKVNDFEDEVSMHYGVIDDSLYWFTDCGDPLP